MVFRGEWQAPGVSHWLDDLGRGLAGGTHSRREVLRRAGLVAAGVFAASVGSPRANASSALPARKGVPCPDANSPCVHPDICCGGSCVSKGPRAGCCHDSTYDPSQENCCPQARSGRGHACFKDESCCGTDACCKEDELCCGGSCVRKGPRVGCCHDSSYDPSQEKCCPQAASGRGHACFKDETCCGTRGCCKTGEECCGSGDKAYCAPKGKCRHKTTAECAPGRMKCGNQCCKPFATTIAAFGASPPSSAILPAATGGARQNVCIIYQTGGSASHPVTDGFCVSTCPPNDLVTESFGKLGKPTTLCCPAGRVPIDCYRAVSPGGKRVKKPIVCVSAASAQQFAATYCAG